MNKIYRYTGIALLAGFTLLSALPSCKKDTPAEAIEQTGLRLVSSDHSFTAPGGSGSLLLSEGGFTLKTEASWIHLGAVEGAKASFTVDALAESTTRTGKILIEKGGKALTLVITQLGAYDYLVDAKATYEIERAGGVITIPYLAQSGSTPELTGLPSWAKATSDGKAISLTVDPLNGPDRSARVKVKLGPLTETEFVLSQVYGQLTYEQLLGEYTLSGLANAETNTAKRTSYPAKLVEKNKSKNLFTLQGLAMDIEVGYDPATSTLILHYLSTTLKDGTPLYFSLWGCGLPNKAGQPNWDLRSTEGRQLRATWDGQSPDHAAFTFKSPKLKAEDEDYAGFLFWKGKADGGFAGYYRWNEAGVISSLANIQMVKK